MRGMSAGRLENLKENGELGENEAAQEWTNAKAAEIFAYFDEVSLRHPTLASRAPFKSSSWRICKRGHC